MNVAYAWAEEHEVGAGTVERSRAQFHVTRPMVPAQA